VLLVSLLFVSVESAAGRRPVQRVPKGYPSHLIDQPTFRAQAFLKESQKNFESVSVNHLLYIYAVGDRATEHKTLSEINYLDRSVRKEVLLQLLDVAVEFFTQNKVEFWMTHGTLLGSYRNQSYIPWDVDADLAITTRGMETVLAIASDAKGRTPLDFFGHPDVQFLVTKETGAYLPFKIVNTTNGVYVDLFLFHPSEDASFDFKWPFENSCYSCQTNPNKWFNVEEEVLHPLQQCEFEGRSLPCPHQTETYLKALYNDLTPLSNGLKEMEAENRWATRRKKRSKEAGSLKERLQRARSMASVQKALDKHKYRS